jgi:hypothetical protein
VIIDMDGVHLLIEGVLEPGNHFACGNPLLIKQLWGFNCDLFHPLNKKVGREGLEPSRSCDRWILSPLRLPIPPPPQHKSNCTQKRKFYKANMQF